MFEQVAFWNGIAKAPVIYGPGPTFDRVTYRSALLNSACRSVPPEFPESDTEWPAWVLEYGEPFK